AGDGEAAAGERVVDAIGQRTLADHCKLRRGGQRTADQRTEGKDEWSSRVERVEVCAPFVEQQPHAQAAAANELAQHRIGQRHELLLYPASGRVANDAALGYVDSKVAAVVTERHGYPPASADRISTRSS